MKGYNSLIENALNEEVDTLKAKNISYEKIEVLGQVTMSSNWVVEISYVSWNNKDPKYEIRRWKTDGTPGKGVTFSEEQFKELLKVMKDIRL